MTTVKTPQNVKPGDQVTFNYYGETFTETVKSVRPNYATRNGYITFTDNHCVDTDSQGNGTKYNGYSTAYVFCDDTPETRAAFEVVRAVMDEDAFNAVFATMRQS